ncbi:putative kelch repeat protein [Paratrimastix pyriformis]|uniref:Kelch repeat protein n=1 Tax=Paratrimastix pyriformis TaxID=342808 RepID=A0ABQ8U7T7_9EUKA|nr:putative kelch repeat protein [Paratrimastix pyriformis]
MFLENSLVPLSPSLLENHNPVLRLPRRVLGSSPGWYKVEFGSVSPPKRFGHTAVSSGNVVIVFGGYGAQSTCFGDIWYLDTAHMRWHRVEPTGESPCKRMGHSATVIGADMLVFGGDNGTNCLNDLWAFDIESEHWMQIKTEGEIPGPRYGHACVKFGNKFLIFGGADRFGKSTRAWYNDVWMFDTITCEWAQLETTGTRPSPRYGCTFTLVNNRLFLFGGFFESERLNDLWELDPASLTVRPRRPPRPALPASLGMVVVGKLVLLFEIPTSRPAHTNPNTQSDTEKQQQHHHQDPAFRPPTHKRAPPTSF